MTMIAPTRILLLKEGTDSSQGVPQILSNIAACEAVADTVRSTLGPRGMDKLIIDNGKGTISNDGATILNLIDVVHPAAKTLVHIARAQDAEVGDGTTSVTLLATEILKQIKPFLEEGVHPHDIIRALHIGEGIALERLQSVACRIKKDNPEELQNVLEKCAATTMSSKLIAGHQDFFSKLVVSAVQHLDQDMQLKMIGIKKVSGGGMEDTQLVVGVAFEKTFSYAGFEMQPKSYKNPKIALLNIELELKAEKENAEVRLHSVEEYQKVVDAEWKILYDKLEVLHEKGVKIVLSKLPIGDVATQYFADRGMFCAGRVPEDDLKRTQMACGGSVQTTVNGLSDSALGTCGSFEEVQIGSKRYNIFKGCPKASACTIVIRGGSEQFMDEVERSLHDSIMVVKRAITSDDFVAGGGAIEMELSAHLRERSRKFSGRAQLIVAALARSFEVIARTLCVNGGLDPVLLLNELRYHHAKGEIWYGVDMKNRCVCNNFENHVWEPAVIKKYCITASVEAACLLLSIDETIKSPESKAPEDNTPVRPRRRA